MWFFLILLIDVFLLLFLPWYLLSLPAWIHLPAVGLFWLWVPRESPRFRSLGLWKYLFNVEFRGKHPAETCIYAIHPHGVFSVSTITGFALNKDLLHVKPVGSSVLFTLPILKDFCGLAGTIPANRESIIAALMCGDSVAMCPGGLRELPQLHPERLEGGVVQRDGFIKIAKAMNVRVVPVWCEGEEDLYDVWLWSPRIQRLFLSWFYYPGFVFSWGRAFWPKNKKIVLHMGKAIQAEELSRETFYRELGKLRKTAE